MGVHIKIALPHNIADVCLATLTAKFQPLDQLFSEILQHFKHPSLEWRDVSGPDHGRPYLFYAPAGFCLSFSPCVLSIHHVARFHDFCTMPDERQLLRRFTYRILNLMAGDRAIYLPCEGIGDEIYDLIFDGLTFNEIEAHLARLGAPALSFEELDARRSPLPRYYIDRFEDFYGETTSVA